MIPLVAPSCSVIYRPRSPMSFSLHTMYDEDAVDYSITTESEEITWAWMGSTCTLTHVPLCLCTVVVTSLFISCRCTVTLMRSAAT